MCNIRRLVCQLVIFAFMLSSIPASAHFCLHDMQSRTVKPAIEKTASDLPPCHQKAAEADQKTENSDTMDCCGDKCTCAAGTCSATKAFLGEKSNTTLVNLSAAAYQRAVADFRPFMPEQATPPPRI